MYTTKVSSKLRGLKSWATATFRGQDKICELLLQALLILTAPPYAGWQCFFVKLVLGKQQEGDGWFFVWHDQ